MQLADRHLPVKRTILTPGYRRCIRALLMSLGLIPGCLSLAVAADTERLMEQGIQASQHGDFAHAATAWQQVQACFVNPEQQGQRIDALVQLGVALQNQGDYPRALQTLKLALSLARQAGDPTREANTLVELGNVYFLAGQESDATTSLERGIASANELDHPDIAAAGLNNLGNLLVSQGHYREARDRYADSLLLAQRVEDPELETRALLNDTRAALALGEITQAGQRLSRAAAQFGRFASDHTKAYTLIAAGRLAQEIHAKTSQPRFLRGAYTSLSQAAELADELGDLRAASYARGYLGELYAQQQQPDEALQLTQRALFAAQQADAPEILYRWQWQTGRLLAQKEEIDPAIGAYRQAVFTLQSIRQDLSAGLHGRSSFREALGPVYFELADLLLQKAASLDNAEQAKPYLIEARETVEKLKVAELQDYFQDECVTALEAKAITLDQLSPQTAVIYPIVLQDRLELLLTLPSGMQQVTVPVSAATLTEEAHNFRRLLEKRTTWQFLPYAQQLYKWLIKPIEQTLEQGGIDTLVFVPDGPLRTIPMAALHDGNQFLVNRFAVATTPGLTLTEPKPIHREAMQLLLSGLTQPVQGFPPLPNVSIELDRINDLYGGKRLQDQDFLAVNLQQALEELPYNIVHIASHGQFKSDVQKTFLLTFDDRLTMDRLEQFIHLSRFREEPVELLTLSACQTAAGDDRAALGLAGVAVKAGARSALATLWFINDRASAELVAEFYRQLQDMQLSKAGALRQAQLRLVNDPRYRHPGYWAPFLLIGNWL